MAFEGKVVIITGASSGIGAATAIKFAGEGANVILVGRNEVKLKKTHEKCATFGKTPLTVIADVSKDDDVKRIINDTVKQFSKIDVLINNAGFVEQAAIDDENAIDVYDRIVATNLRAVVLLTSLASKHIIETKGNIINISSVAALDVIGPKHFAYCTSKAGLDHFTKSAALDLSSKGVRVNSINPGPVETDIMGDKFTKEQKEALFEMGRKMTALRRFSQPEEIADLVLFVASDKAIAITGSIFVSDNGFLINKSIM